MTKNYARSSSNWDTDSMRNYLKQKGSVGATRTSADPAA